MQNLEQSKRKEQNSNEKQTEQTYPQESIKKPKTNQFDKNNKIDESHWFRQYYSLMCVGLNGINFSQFADLEKCHKKLNLKELELD
ncbi:unnamed protein product [Paramecium sonneborni]|uniref:Uncharacterized protein n=1 Tax=Paramecium sonneborni TaxID=65129 RepID=A0A8S1RPE1_9CILI|nr:unnamed protein product [Paramecium sonneborni]